MKLLSIQVALLSCLAQIACAQKGDIYLIVRADDIGFAHTVNRACIDSYSQGIARSVEVMVNTPWFPEAVRLLNQHPGYDVGLHLTLTSEWENIKWRPLTSAPGLCDDHGYFHPFIWRNQVPGATFLTESEWTIDEVEAEFRAQIELARRHLPHISHLSGHMGCTHADPRITEVYKKLAAEYGLDIDPSEYGVKQAPGFGGSQTSPEEKVQNFIAMIHGLSPGIWLFVDHPGYDTEELRGVGHVGYENVATDREGVTRAFTDERVRAAIQEKGIKLISYRDLLQMKKTN